MKYFSKKTNRWAFILGMMLTTVFILSGNFVIGVAISIPLVITMIVAIEEDHLGLERINAVRIRYVGFLTLILGVSFFILLWMIARVL